MAKAKVVHSTDACHIIFEGDKRHPEPVMGVIQFPGGHVEVSRCDDGSYWAHISMVAAKNNTESRIDYETPGRTIPPIPYANDIKHLAIRIAPKVDWPEY